MSDTFFFYDLETTGLDPKYGRIMQFAGQRTDLDLKPIGDPTNILIKLTEDVLPDPDAVMVTGITPQQTIAEGISEAQFLELFNSTISLPGTIFTGYNNIRFDDEFMRFTQYRNLYDPYVWQWKDGRSRWDLLDLVRMTRALRPEGIKWPIDSEGKATNRLELMTKANKLSHQKAHDALSDVAATIEVARLVKTKQPRLFDFSFNHRDKKSVEALVMSGHAFLYTSGKYSSEFEKTNLVQVLTKHPSRAGALVYDLRQDPSLFKDRSVSQLVEDWTRRRDDPGLRLPVKTLLFNRCPAIAPISVLDEHSKNRLKLDIKKIAENQTKLSEFPDFTNKVIKALAILDDNQERRSRKYNTTADSQLYDDFFSNTQKNQFQFLHSLPPDELVKQTPKFSDKRAEALFPLFIYRNYPLLLSSQQTRDWEIHRRQVLLGDSSDNRLSNYFNRIKVIESSRRLNDNQKQLLKDLKSWGRRVTPLDDKVFGDDLSIGTKL